MRTSLAQGPFGSSRIVAAAAESTSSRTPSAVPTSLLHRDGRDGRLRKAGFSVEMAVHAYSVQDAYIYGFAL
jgi:hypothetical protein